MEIEETIKILKEFTENGLVGNKGLGNFIEAIDTVLNELDNADKRIKMLIDLLNNEGCLNYDTYDEKIKYIDKLIELEN